MGVAVGQGWVCSDIEKEWQRGSWGPSKCYVTLFFWKLDPPPRNANKIEYYTFVTLFFIKSDTPPPHLRYVTLEWPLGPSSKKQCSLKKPIGSYRGRGKASGEWVDLQGSVI